MRLQGNQGVRSTIRKQVFRCFRQKTDRVYICEKESKVSEIIRLDGIGRSNSHLCVPPYKLTLIFLSLCYLMKTLCVPPYKLVLIFLSLCHLMKTLLKHRNFTNRTQYTLTKIEGLTMQTRNNQTFFLYLKDWLRMNERDRGKYMNQ